MKSEGNDTGFLVAKALLNDDRLGKAIIEVEDHEGKIILRGEVESMKFSREAESVARHQQGVVQVINELLSV